MIRLRTSLGGQHFLDAEPRLLRCDVGGCVNTVRPEDSPANGWRHELIEVHLLHADGAWRATPVIVDACARHAPALAAMAQPPESH